MCSIRYVIVTSKMHWFYSFFLRQYLCNVIWTSQLKLSSLWLFPYHILRLFFPVNMALIFKKRFYHVPTAFICNNTIFGNVSSHHHKRNSLMLLLSINWNVLLLQMCKISKFNFAIKSLETLCVFRTLGTNILLIPCTLHLAAIFKIFSNKICVPEVLFNRSFIPTWIIAVLNWPSPSVQYRTRDHLKWPQENIWTWPCVLLIDY